MTKILFYLCFFLSVALLFCIFRIRVQDDKICALETEKNGLKIELKRREEVAQNVQEREKVVEKLVYQDKTVFDWNADIADTAVVGELQINCKSCSNTAY